MRRRPSTAPRPRRRLDLMSYMKRKISGFNRKRRQETKRDAAMAKQNAEINARREARRKASGSSTSKSSPVKKMRDAIRTQRTRKRRTVVTPRPIGTQRPRPIDPRIKLPKGPTTGKATIRTAKQIRKPAAKPVTVKAPAPKKRKVYSGKRVDPVFATRIKRRRG